MANQNGVKKPQGEVEISAIPATPRIMLLTPLQRDYLQQYAISLNQATAKVEAARSALKLAEEAEGQAQNAANAFLRFCAEDLDVDLRVWTFDQQNLRFVRMDEGENHV